MPIGGDESQRQLSPRNYLNKAFSGDRKLPTKELVIDSQVEFGHETSLRYRKEESPKDAKQVGDWRWNDPILDADF